MLTVSEELAKVGVSLKKQLDQFISDRQVLEVQWLKNLRQYAGTYDPEIASMIPTERSHVYPRDTRIKVKGGVAKLMEMMFPAQDNNWELAISPVPSIPKDDLNRIIEELQAQVDEQGQPVPVDGESIEREVKKFAKKRMENMQDEIRDQLDDPGMDYPQLAKKTVRSGYIYGCGIAKAPLVKTQTERIWVIDKRTGEYVAKEVMVRRPYAEYIRVWDCYPDLAAKSWDDQEMFFERIILTRHDFRALAKRPDFKKSVIKEYLRNNATGNYTAKSYESELQLIEKTSNLSDRTARRYEIYRALGFVSAHSLVAAGVEIAEDKLDEDVFADLWVIDDIVIKAEVAAFGEKISDQYHAFIYAEDEDSGLTGIGLPEEVRDSQMSLCASTRMLMDNGAAVAGPIFEVNTTLLPHGRKSIGEIHAFMTIEREGDGIEAQYPAVRQLTTDSHINDLLKIISMQRQQLDVESNLPAFAMGGMQQQPNGEAFRTTSNMSMLMGSANMITKDTVRAFDKFTTSIIGAFLAWNMEFNDKDDIKGDYQVRATGNLSLVAKEVRGAALDQFVTTLSQEDKAILDTYGILIDRLKSRDLPTDRVLPKEEAEKILSNMRAAAAQNAKIEQGLTQAKTADASAGASKKQNEATMIQASADAAVREILSRIEANLAKAKNDADKTQLENLKTLMTTATQGDQGGQTTGK